MAEVTLSSEIKVNTTNDNIVIVKCLEDIAGGKILNVADWTPVSIPAGHPIIKDDDGEYKPLALNAEGTAIDATKAAKTIGILKATILTAQAMASIMIRGTVNEAVAMFAIPEAAKTPLSLIRFMSED